MRAGPALLVCVAAGACAPRLTWTALSPDHRSGAEARQHGRQACVRVAETPERCWDSVALGALAFSDSGGHSAYPAEVGGRWTVVRDGRPGAMWDGVAAPVFAPGGSRLAYAALDAGGWRVVLDDSAGERWDSIYAGSLAFDPTGRRAVYAATRGGVSFAVVDGLPGEPWLRVGRLSLSADGRRIAYVALGAAGAQVVVDGRAGGPHQAIADLILSPDGSRVAYAARDGNAWFVEDGARSYGPYAAARAPRFIGEGGGLLWVTRDSAGERVVLNGVAGPRWDSVGDPVVAETRARWGYVGYDSAGAAVVVNDSVVARERWAANLLLSRDGARAAWLARRSDDFAVVDDAGAHPFPLIIDGTLTILRDGRSWACLAGERRRKRLFVVRERSDERRPFDWSEITRLLQAGAGEETVRAWVRAEAELMRVPSGR